MQTWNQLHSFGKIINPVNCFSVKMEWKKVKLNFIREFVIVLGHYNGICHSIHYLTFCVSFTVIARSLRDHSIILNIGIYLSCLKFALSPLTFLSLYTLLLCLNHLFKSLYLYFYVSVSLYIKWLSISLPLFIYLSLFLYFSLFLYLSLCIS